MNTRELGRAELKPGLQITAWQHRNGQRTHGQGGTIAEVGDVLVLDCPFGKLDYALDGSVLFDVEEAMDPSECLNFGPDCKGPVDYHTTGTAMRAWPRCDFHQEQRQKSYDSEDSSEKWADSSVPPPWIDRYGIGERWDDD